MEPTNLPPTLGTARNADELATAARIFVWYEHHYRGQNIPLAELSVPGELFVTWDRFVLDWLDVSVDEMAVVNRTLVAVLGNGARWVPWPPGSESPDDVRAAPPIPPFTFEIRESGESVVELPSPVFLDVMEVHQRWLAIPKESRPEHPLVTVIDRRQSPTPDEARISHAEHMTGMPYAASEVVRRLWLEDRAVTDVKLSGKPLIEHLDIGAIADSMLRWLYADRFSLVDTSGVLRLKLRSSSNIYPQDPRKGAVPMVAWPGYDHRLRKDLWLLLAVVYGSTKAIVWTEQEGARLLARNAGGGFRRPAADDIHRWHRLVEYAASIEIWYRDKRGDRFEKVVYRQQLTNNRVSIDKPAWYRRGGGQFTLTGAAHRARHVGEGLQYQLLIGCMEYWLARSFDSDSDDKDVAPLLRPTRGKNGPGPWAPAPSGRGTWWEWHEVLEVLMAEPVIDRNDTKARVAAQRRYWRMVEGMRAAGYLSRRPANGDSVEVEASTRRRGVSPTLRFRAAAGFCGSARLAQDRKWSTTPLFDWVGMPESDATGPDAERVQRRDLRERRKALTLDVVEEAVKRNDGNVAKAERELDVGGSTPGDYLHRWLRRHRNRRPSPPPRDDPD